MGIYGALTTAVTGLKAQSHALENISGNIANSQTTAFKRTDTSFVDYVVENNPKRQKSGIVSAFSRQTNDIQGDIVASGTSTSMAINGSGYFTVERLFDYSDRQLIFNGENLYSRRGDFQLDRFGHLVNGGGHYLKGLPIDEASQNVASDVTEIMKIQADFLGAQGTTAVDVRANIPTVPKTIFAGSGAAGANEFMPSGPAPASNFNQTGDVTNATTEEEFLEKTVAGGAVTAFNSAGSPMNMQMRWGKVAAYDATVAGGYDAATNSDQWALFYKSADNTYTRIEPDGGTGNFVFNADGTLNTGATFGTAATATPTSTLDLVVGGERIDGLKINWGNGGLTQYADPSGAFQATELDQNGYPAGEMVDVEVTDLGRIRVNYSNGISKDRYEIPLVTFNSENNLRSLDGGAYAKTDQSGNPIQGAQSTIVGASLEASNTDIAEEFSKLIITQQAYSANTRIVSSSDEMMQETRNMKR